MSNSIRYTNNDALSKTYKSNVVIMSISFERQYMT